MKCRYMTILLVMILLCSCTNKLEVTSSENTKDEKGIKQNVLALLNNLYKDEPVGIGELKLRKLDEEYVLAEVKRLDTPQDVNGSFVLVNTISNTCNYIITEEDGRVVSVEYVDKELVFIYDGSNIYNGYKIFPYKKVYNISNNSLRKEETYSSVYTHHLLGNFINEMIIENIKAENKSILFDFGINENTILAGGDFCPRIETGFLYDSNIFYISFENVVQNDYLVANINKIAGYDFIKEVYFKEYVDQEDNRMLTIYIDLEDIKEYNCQFGTDEEGFHTFEIVFR